MAPASAANRSRVQSPAPRKANASQKIGEEKLQTTAAADAKAAGVKAVATVPVPKPATTAEPVGQKAQVPATPSKRRWGIVMVVVMLLAVVSAGLAMWKADLPWDSYKATFEKVMGTYNLEKAIVKYAAQASVQAEKIYALAMQKAQQEPAAAAAAAATLCTLPCAVAVYKTGLVMKVVRGVRGLFTKPKAA